jgi:hypothetical protein
MNFYPNPDWARYDITPKKDSCLHLRNKSVLISLSLEAYPFVRGDQSIYVLCALLMAVWVAIVKS